MQRGIFQRARAGEVLFDGGLSDRRDLVFADADGAQAGRVPTDLPSDQILSARSGSVVSMACANCLAAAGTAGRR